MPRPTAPMPARGRYSLGRAPARSTAPSGPVTVERDREWAAHQDLCPALGPATCQGPTDWPPMTSWERYAAQRLAGERVPPSVSSWREQDRRRQAAAERMARDGAPVSEPRAVAWGPGCDDRKAVG